MNAGAHGKEMKDIVETVTAINYEGKQREFTSEELQFSYRNSIFSKEKWIIIETKLRLYAGEKEKIEERMREYAEYRKEKQPIEFPSAGSTFKRGDDYITASLIDQAGLKGHHIGGAEVSIKHAGFIINKGEATAKDVLDLVKYIQEKVYEKFGKNIQLEIEILGDS